ALAVGLIAHPDVFLYLPIFAYIIGLKLWQSRDISRPHLLWIGGSSLIFAIIAGLFYIPYLFDPNIGAVQQYFADDRIGDDLLYNRVDNLFDQDKRYSTRYHAPFLVLLLLWLWIRNFAQWGWRGQALVGVLSIAMVTTVAWPDVWIINELNVGFIPYALLTLLFILLPRTRFEVKVLFLWVMVTLGGLLFLAKDAADHIQIAYSGWAILSAWTLVNLWEYLGLRPSNASFLDEKLEPDRFPVVVEQRNSFLTKRVGHLLKGGLVSLVVILTGLIVYYQYLVFNITVASYWDVKIDSTYNPNSVYNSLYGTIPRPRQLFSNPRLGGWKAVGYLRAQNSPNSDFRSVQESFAVPIWYNFQTPRSCYEDPDHYWLRRDWRGWPDKEQSIIEQGYTLTHIVLVDQQPKLHLYQKSASVAEPEIVDSEAYRRRFDLLATPARFAQAGEVQGQQTDFDFGNGKLRMIGYAPPPQTAQPGQLLPVSVYWEGVSLMDIRYRGFMHLVGADGTVWGQHDDDPACRLLTTDMRPGQQSSRQFRIPIAADTPPGEYTVIFGLYHPDTFERLAIWDHYTATSPGNSLILGTVVIE
ncbi:MAG: hypothetical protein AAF485_23685, partial [Chloroflexota bacterium]